MARTAIAAQAFASLKSLPLAGGASQPTLTVADVVNNQATPMTTGPIFILAYNTHASLARTVTINSVADPIFGRTGDITADSIPALGIALYGPFYPTGWQQADGNLYFQASATDIKFAVMKSPT